MIPQRRMNPDFNQAYEELEDDLKENLEGINIIIDKYLKENEGINSEIDSSEIKKIIALLCLKLVEQTPRDKIAIMETSYLIAGHFLFYNYGKDNLGEIISIAGELELPEKHVSGDVFEMWDKMKRLLKRYLDK